MANQLIIIGTDAQTHLVAVQAGDIINTDQDEQIVLPDNFSIENLMQAGHALIIQLPGGGTFSIQHFFDHIGSADAIMAYTALDVYHFAPTVIIQHNSYSNVDISLQLSVGIQVSMANNDLNIDPLQVAPGAKFNIDDIREGIRIAQHSYVSTMPEDAQSSQPVFIGAAALPLLKEQISAITTNQSQDDPLITRHFSLTVDNAVLIKEKETLIIQPKNGTAPIEITHYFLGVKHITDHQAIYDVLDTNTLPTVTGQGQKIRFVGINVAAMLTPAALAAIQPTLTIKYMQIGKNNGDDHDVSSSITKNAYFHMDESAFLTYPSIDTAKADTRKLSGEKQADKAQENEYDDEASIGANANTNDNTNTKILDNDVEDETVTIEPPAAPTIQLFDESQLQAPGDGPMSLDNTFFGTEDQSYAFAASDFGFSGDTSQQQIAVTTLPTNGTLQLDSIDVILNQIINISSFTSGELIFDQPPDANGSTYTTFGFRVNSGLGFSDQFTMTANIANVNDAPSMNNSHLAALATITEDDVNNSGHTVANILDDSMSDIDPSAVEGIAITSLDSSNGTWQYQIDGVNWVNVGTVSTSQALLLRATDSLRFVPDAQNSDSASVTFIAWDQSSGSTGNKVDTNITGDTTAFSATSNTSSITVTALNDAPTASNNIITINEDATYTFLASDFGFADVDDTNDSLQQVQITSLASAGSLELSSVAVALNQVISIIDINAGNLKFTPATDANGNSHDSFSFKVHDGSVYSDNTYTMTFDVTAVQDVPSASNNTVTTNEDTTHTFTASDFNFSDPDSGDSLQQVQITSLASVGTLELSGAAVTLNQVISEANITAGNLKFIPVANANGANYDSFAFKVHDGTEYSSSAFTLTIDVTAVNDIPTASANTVSTNEDTSYVFVVNDFNFSDIDGSDSLQQIQVTSLETAGSLELSGSAVTLNQVISVADITAGNLKFVPAADVNGNGYDSFSFKVHDGSVYSTNAYTMTVDVTAVQDIPTASNKTVTTNEESTYTFTTSDFNFADVDSADTLQQIQITRLESAGALELSGTAVTFNQVISVANITAGNLKFIPVTDANGLSYDSFSFKVHDGTDYSSSAYTMTIDVTAVQDIPTASASTATATEDTPYTFSVSDFNFADVDSGDSLQQVQITRLERAGALQLSGADVTLNQVITVVDITAGNLKWVPVADQFGAGYADFTFKVHDGTAYSSSSYEMTVNVTGINDLPTSSNVTIDVGQNAAYLFKGGNFSFTDIDGTDVITQVKITSLESLGVLEYNSGSWADVTLNQEVTINDINAGNLRFTASGSGDGYDSFQFQVHDGTAYSSDSYTMTIDSNASDKILWISTKNDVTAGGTPGNDTWGKGSLVEIGDPNLATGTTSGGTFSALVDFDTLGDGDVGINALHYVSRDTTTGGLNLLAGDLLFSTEDNEVFAGTTYNDEDVVYFRPTTAGDYTAGTFGWVLNMGGNVTNDINSIVLVEQETTVGTTTLNAGDFIFTDENKNENIFRFEVTQAGSTTSGTTSTLITSNSINIATRVNSLSLVETTNSDYYGTAITAGNLIASIRNDAGATVGDNKLSVLDSDLFLLDVTNSTTATASMFFEGSDVNLNTSSEDINAFTFKDSSNSAPTLDNAIADQPSSGTYFAGEVNSFTFAGNTFSDPDSDPLTYTAKLSDNNPLPSWMMFDAATRTFTYDPAMGAVGVNTIVVTASDTYSNQVSDTFTITVTDPNHTLDGDDSANTITGTSVADTIHGFAGDDTIRGANGNDTLYGGTGNDYLLGQVGNDTLKGGFGDDNLKGDSGVDTLTGNEGADVFIWNDASHSGIGSGNRDVITDFSQSDLDKIDFTGLDLNYIGTAAFSGTANEVRWSQSGGNTIIEVDSDGNGSADFEIELTGLITLTPADFSGILNQPDFILTSGTDNFTGGSADEIFYSTAANYSTVDTLDGAAGADTLSLNGGGTFAPFQSNLSNLETISVANDGSYTLTVDNPSGLQTIDGSALTGSNTLTVNAAAATSGLTLTGGAGNDSLTGGLAADTINGGDGNDIIYGDAQAFTSASIAGLQAWFDASDVSADGSTYSHNTQLTTWANKVSAGPDATTAFGNVGVLYKTTSDTLNGRTALDFSNNEGMTLGTGTLGSTGLYSGAGDAFTAFVISDSGVGTTGTLLARAGSTQTLRTFQIMNVNVGNSDISTLINGATTYYNEIHDDNPYQISYVWDGSSATHYLDGSASTPAVDVGGAAEETSQNITIGARTGGTGYQLDGRIAEILVFDVALSTVDMAIVQNYLAAKYNLAIAGVSPGADTLTGGNGADTFTWSNASYSGVGSGNRDIVTDFNEGAGDTIDLSSYLSTPMQLGGNAAFTGTANELIWTQEGANTLVQLDYNGNSTVDFEIQLNDVTASTLTEAAFIFGHVIGTLGADTLTVGDTGYTVSAKTGDDIITGGSGDDTLNGAVGNDTLVGGAGNDTLTGGADNDILEGGAGADILNGQGETDTLTYANSGSAVTVDIGADTASGGDAAGDTISNFENLTGSAYNDTLIGGYGANTINGGAGNDIIIGDSASFINSSVSGIALWLDGNDLSTVTKSGVNVSQWSDKSDQSNDATQGGTDSEKPDFVYRSGRGAMQFNDTDSYFAADGAASIANSEYTLFIVMEAAATLSSAGNFMAFNDSGTGNIELWRIKDGTGNILYRDTNTTTISSSDHRGDDTIFTAALDSSTIYPYLNGAALATVAETLDGGATRFSLGHEWGGASSNSNFYNGYIFEVLLVDHKVTSPEQNLIEQYLSYRSGIALSGQSFGVDTLTGGTGADTFTWTNASHSAVGSGNRDIITDFNQSEFDKIDVSGFAPTYVGQSAFSGTANEVRWIQSGGNTLVQIDYNQDAVADIEIELTGLHTLVSGDFVLVPIYNLTASADNFTGTTGNDVFNSGAGTYSTADTLNGAGGTDTLNLFGGATATIQSNVSNIETISVADGGSYTLTVDNPSGLQTIDGSALTGSNTLTVNAAAATSGLTLTGGAGNDSLTGGLAADTIHGGDGNDIIYGDAQAFTSASIAGLQAWFDASDVSADGTAYAHDTQLTTWVNKISAGPDATTATGNVGVLYKTTSDTLNGRTALDFSNNEGMTLGTGTLGSTGLYSGAGDAFTVFIINDSDVGTTGTLLARAGSTQALRTLQIINTNVEDSDIGTVINGVTTYANEIHDDNPYQVSYMWDGNSATHYLDGSVSTPSVGVGAAVEETSEDITIGARTADDTGYELDGRIAEILVFDVALSTIDMGIVQNYLAAKYNLAIAGVSPGADTLTGGNGADTFTWSNASYSGVGSGNRDIITDFNEGAGDTIDLSTYLSTAMQLGGNAAFTGIANELIWTQDGANTLVQLDYNGNSTVDFEIQLNDVTASTLTEAAFIFGNVIGTSGNDTLKLGDGGHTADGSSGIDTYTGGSGNDTFLLDQNDLVADATYNGGAGADIIKFNGSGETLNITTITSANSGTSTLSNLEEMDMNASNNTITLTLQDVIDMTDGDNELYISGGIGDTINATGTWGSNTGTTNYNGKSYDTYAPGTATLYVEQDITNQAIL